MAGDSIARFGLAFAAAAAVASASPPTDDSLAHYAKGTRARVFPLPPLVDAGFQDLFHSPRRGAFHLSLTVLVHYRSLKVFSLRRWSSQIPTRFLVSRGTRVSDPE